MNYKLSNIAEIYEDKLEWDKYKKNGGLNYLVSA